MRLAFGRQFLVSEPAGHKANGYITVGNSILCGGRLHYKRLLRRKNRCPEQTQKGGRWSVYFQKGSHGLACSIGLFVYWARSDYQFENSWPDCVLLLLALALLQPPQAAAFCRQFLYRHTHLSFCSASRHSLSATQKRTFFVCAFCLLDDSDKRNYKGSGRPERRCTARLHYPSYNMGHTQNTPFSEWNWVDVFIYLRWFFILPSQPLVVCRLSLGYSNGLAFLSASTHRYFSRICQFEPVVQAGHAGRFSLLAFALKIQQISRSG